MNSIHNEMVYGKPWIIRLLLVVLMLDVLLLGGCGKAKMEKDGSEQAETGIEESDFVYVPEFIDLKLHEDVEADHLWINGVRLVKGKVIYNLRVTNSGEQIVSNYIFTREQEDYEQKAEVPRKAVPNGEKEFVNFCSYDAEGNFYVFWEQRGEKSYQICDFLSKYDKDYNLVYTKEVTDVWVNDNNSDIRKMEFDSNGKIYACAQNIVYVFDENGGLEKHFRLGTSQVSQLFVREDGGVYIAYMDNSADGYELKLAVLNMETGKREEPIEGLPYGCTEAWEGRNNKILLNHTGRLWEFDLETKEAKALFKWTDMYINSEQIRALNMTDTGEIIILSNVDNSNPLIPQYEIAYLKKTDKSQVMEKEVLTLATLYESDSFLTEAVARFNRGNQQYRVEIKGYMDESVKYTWENYEDAIARFQADLVSGQAGDLINLKSMDWRNLARAGALEELTPYMSSGEGVRREDFVESVVKAYELEGKCYTLPRGFIIQTLMGKETVVGAREEWSLEKIMMLAKVYPEAKVLHLGNSYMLLRFCMQYGGKAFMDYEKAECHFNTQEFIELLEFCKQGVAGQTPNMDLYSNVKMDRVLLEQISIDSIEEYQMYSQLFCGEGICVGYPTANEGGQAILSGEEMIAIAANSSKKEGAWEFLESFLQQKTWSHFAFPTLLKDFESEIEEACKVEYLYDEEGNLQYDENGQPMQKLKTTWGYGSFNAEIYAATEEEIAAFRELLKYVDSNQMEEDIWNIICEEAGAYFEGQKTASEVAGIIQNRVQLYLFENAK